MGVMFPVRSSERSFCAASSKVDPLAVIFPELLAFQLLELLKSSQNMIPSIARICALKRKVSLGDVLN